MQRGSLRGWGFVISCACFALLGGCSHSDCQTDADCSSDQRCTFPIDAGCSAKGQCQDKPSGAICDAIESYCGCDGSMVSAVCGYPGASGPVAGPYTGSCGHGNVDAGTACALSADCGAGQECYFPINGGCAASGVCLAPLAGVAANACESAPSYCACNGVSVVQVCGGRQGYTAVPVSRAVDLASQCFTSSPNDGGALILDAGEGGSH